MGWSSWPDAEKHGIGAAIAVVIGSTILANIVMNSPKGESATFIAILVIAVIVYGVVSGKIHEFSAPGGWSAKFQEVSRQKVDTTATPISNEMKELQPVEKQSLEALEQILPTLPKGKPIALILFFGRRNYQILAVVQDYFKRLRAVDSNIVVILVEDKSEHFVCMIEGHTFLELLDDEEQNFIDAINNGDIGYLRRLNKQRQSADIVFRKLTKNKTNVDALRDMKEFEIRSMVVVDETSKPVAIVRRDEIVAHLFEELAN